MTHRETLDLAAANGCYTVAFTDHDILMTPAILDDLKSSNHKTRWISGIELSTEMGHVIGIFVDPANPDLLAHTLRMKEERKKKALAMAGALSALGFKVTAEEVLERAGEGNVAKPHLVEVVVSHAENLPLLETYIDKLRVASETDEELRKEYTEAKDMSVKNGIGMYLYPLFLRSRAFIPGVHQDFSTEPSLEKGVELIHNSGGLAILAHWHTVKKNIPLDRLEKLLSEDKLDGVETLWGLNLHDTGGEEEIKMDNKIVRELVARLGKLPSASLDAHSPADYALLGRSDAFAQETLGMLEKIIERSGVSTKFSTIEV